MTSILLILPALNEAERLPAVLTSVRRAGLDAQVVVIDDGSTDGTARVGRSLGARVLRHPFNLGYGAALQTGYKYALRHGAPLVVQMDADGQHDPSQIPALIAPILAGTCDLVIGSRFLVPTGYRMSLLQTVGRRFFQSLGRLAGVRISDPTSGFQALNERALALFAADFFPSDYPDVDVLVAAVRSGIRIQELPVTMRAATRRSTLHGGVRNLYYAYKMLVSLWAETAGPGKSPARHSVSARPGEQP